MKLVVINRLAGISTLLLCAFWIALALKAYGQDDDLFVLRASMAFFYAMLFVICPFGVWLISLIVRSFKGEE